VVRVFDLHCDTPHCISKNKFNHIIPSRLYQQGYTGAIFAHFVDPKDKHPFAVAVKMITSTTSYIERRSRLKVVQQHSAMEKNKANILLGVEGGYIYDGDYPQVEALYGLGVRVFTLTWNNSNRLAHSALEADAKGLTRLGREYMKKSRGYDIILDMSHASTRTVLDVCKLWEGKIIASHSCVRKLNPSFLRNIDDPAIRAIKQRGGVVGINFSRYHLGKTSVADHIDYLCQNYGVSCAAIGSDFDGIKDPVIGSPTGIRKLEKILTKKGYSKADINRIFNDNFLRVFRRVAVRNT
jgi:membrane dipeptidase